MDYRLESLRYQLQEDPTSRVFFQLGELLRKEGQLEEARQILEAGLEHHPRYVAAWVSLGRAQYDLGACDRAESAFAHALEIDPENQVAARLIGESAIARGDLVRAVKAFKLARALSPRDPELDERIAGVEARLAQAGLLETAPGPRRSALVAAEADEVFVDADAEPAAEVEAGDIHDWPTEKDLEPRGVRPSSDDEIADAPLEAAAPAPSALRRPPPPVLLAASTEDPFALEVAGDTGVWLLSDDVFGGDEGEAPPAAPVDAAPPSAEPLDEAQAMPADEPLPQAEVALPDEGAPFAEPPPEAEPVSPLPEAELELRAGAEDRDPAPTATEPTWRADDPFGPPEVAEAEASEGRAAAFVDEDDPWGSPAPASTQKVVLAELDLPAAPEVGETAASPSWHDEPTPIEPASDARPERPEPEAVAESSAAAAPEVPWTSPDGIAAPQTGVSPVEAPAQAEPSPEYGDGETTIRLPPRADAVPPAAFAERPLALPDMPPLDLPPEGPEAPEEPMAAQVPLPTLTLARLAVAQGDLELAERTLESLLRHHPESDEAAELLEEVAAHRAEGAAAPAGPAPAAARIAALQGWLEGIRLAAERRMR